MAHATDYTKKKECEVKALPMEEKKRLVAEHKAHWFFPRHMVEQVLQCMLVMMILITLSTLLPAHLDLKADPFDTPAHIKPEWYFLAAFYALKFAEHFAFLGEWAPKLLGIALQGAFVGALLAVPWLDRGSPSMRDYRRRPIAMAMFGVTMFVMLLFTFLGWAA